MKLLPSQTYFTFTRSQRIGLLVLFAIIISIQGVYIFADSTLKKPPSKPDGTWVSLQSQIDSAKISKGEQIRTVRPYNPNFITDYKGYTLGMSVEEIDRLLEFRKENKYVNSAREFQMVTKVSDSLLNVMAPNFKFPDWVNNRKYSKFTKLQAKYPVAEKAELMDINTATAEDLIKVYGIGPALSERILKQKATLGAFVSIEQMKDIWGLSEETIANIAKKFAVLSTPEVKKLKINSATMNELGQFPYFRYPLSKAIITYRSMNGPIKNAEDLTKINGFPIEKVDIIALYLEF